MIENTETYYRRRWSEELAAAEQAADPIVANIHRSMAARYSVLAGDPQVRAVEPERAQDLGEDSTVTRFG